MGLRYPRESPPVLGRRAAPTDEDFSAPRGTSWTFRRAPRGPEPPPSRPGGRAWDAGGSGSTGPRSPAPAGAGTGSARSGPPQGLATAPVLVPRDPVLAGRAPRGGRHLNDPSAGSPTETLLRLLLPLNDQVWTSFRQFEATGAARNASPEASLNHSIGSSDGRCVLFIYLFIY